MKSTWYWRLKVEWELRQFVDTIRRGFWLTAGDVLWLLAIYRVCYYAYREQVWRTAQGALSFEAWLQAGGLLAPWRQRGQ